MSNEEFLLSGGSYQGPIETLLDLIESRKLSISEISLAEVCDAYIAHIEKLPALPVGETAQFIVVASTLLLIKSRSLLPTLSLTEEEKESVDELERRLARLRVVRARARKLRSLFRHRASLSRRALIFPVFAPGTLHEAGLHASMKRILARLPKSEKRPEARVAPIVALEEIVLALKKRLSQAARTSWREIVRTSDRATAIVYFLAMLELIKEGSVSATQEALFSDIILESDDQSLPRYGS